MNTDKKAEGEKRENGNSAGLIWTTEPVRCIWSGAPCHLVSIRAHQRPDFLFKKNS
jgi:hypothetical protein